MKILATPIEVLAYYEQSGKINPLRMKLNGETIKIYQHHLKVRAREKLSAFAPGAFFCVFMVPRMDKTCKPPVVRGVLYVYWFAYGIPTYF